MWPASLFSLHGEQEISIKPRPLVSVFLEVPILQG